MNKEIRWQQRFNNLSQAFNKFESAVEDFSNLSLLEKEGLVQRFEYTFELCWKTLKDYLESVGVEAKFPRDVIKQSFKYNLIDDGEVWIDMLEKPNLLSHCYDETLFETMLETLVNDYYVQIQSLQQTLQKL